MSEASEDLRRVWSVTELNRAARELLEGAFPRVWVEGEVSNWKVYASGHAYFSLKDAGGQISAAWFGVGRRAPRFEVRDGMAVIARGQVTVYGPRGSYQLVVEELEPKGVGALQLAFEQLKRKLEAEGLFDASRKRPLPTLPRAIGIVTSPSGAALRDLLTVLGRRFPNLRLVVNPVRVQGEAAAAEIAAAIGELGRVPGVDVLIVGRGGGSIEDLWAFNEEVVARAIAASAVPVISAVGHETDFTIADFVADLRAPTPSAAAELVVRSKAAWEDTLANLRRHLRNALGHRLREARHRLEALAVRRMGSDRRRQLQDLAQRVDELDAGLRRETAGALAGRRERLSRLQEALGHLSPRSRWGLLRERLHHAGSRLEAAGRRPLRAHRERVLRAAGQLAALSPLGVLARGYSICRRLPGLAIVKDAAEAPPGSEVRVLLHRGELRCRVEDGGV
jgi:exodeoxyribonuclease VII large subunit